MQVPGFNKEEECMEKKTPDDISGCDKSVLKTNCQCQLPDFKMSQGCNAKWVEYTL